MSQDKWHVTNVKSESHSPKLVAMLLSNAFRPDPRVLKEAQSLAKVGYEVTVIAWDREDKLPSEERVDGFTVRRVQDVRSSYGAGARQMFRLPRFWLRAWRELSSLQPHVVHCHDFDTLPPGWLWATLHRRRVIYDAHEYYVELQKPRLKGLVGKVLLPLIGIAEQLLSRSASAVVTVDERIARRYHNRRVVIIGHYPPIDFADEKAIDTHEESQAVPPPLDHPSRSPLPAHLSSEPVSQSSRSPILVYAGRFSTDRGMLVIAQALQQLAAIDLRPRLRLLGTWTNKAEEQAFTEAIRGLEGQIETVGWVPFNQVAHQLRQANVALAVLQPIPRYVAALPVKLFEYMACGLPVVISDFPPNRAVVADADCGVLVDPADVSAVAAAIQRLLTSPDDARRLGRNGRHAFETRYNWQTLEPRLFDLYSSLID